MWQPKHPDYEAYVRLKHSRNKFLQDLGYVIDVIQPGLTEGHLDFKEKHEQQNGFLHGGIISTLCDMACGFAAYTLVDEGTQVFTVELKVSFLRTTEAGTVYAKGWIVKPGRMFHFCEGEVFERQGAEKRLIAKATTTMAVVNRAVNDQYGD